MYSRKYIRPAVVTGSITPERPTPPPDYAGVAFRTSDARTKADFPETVIPAVETFNEGTALTKPEPSPSDEAPISERTVFTASSADSPPAPDTAEEEMPDCSDSFDCLEPEQTAYMSRFSPAISDSPEESESESSQAIPSTDIFTPTDDQPLKWLKALKMEDLMLFWMLLMLLYGEANEEIELLLCLLLFAGS